MPDPIVSDRPRTKLFCTALVAAPVLLTIELFISPLANGTTLQDMATIQAAPTRFTVSVMIGTIGTFLLLPGLLGLVRRSSARSPRFGLLLSVLVGLQVLGFAGVRAVQGSELGLATSGLSTAQAAKIMDASTSTPILLIFGICFLGLGTLGWALLGIALWRSRQVPIPAVCLFLIFPILDWLAPTQQLSALAHVVLAGAYVWMAACFLRSTPIRRAVVSTEPGTVAETV